MNKRQNILVIDDDEAMLETLQALLSEHGYQVVTRSTPIGATQTILREDIHLVIVDLRMPIMQGDRLISLLRSWERVREVPVILISGSRRKSLHEVADDLEGVVLVTKEEIHSALPALVSRALLGTLSRPPMISPESASRRRSTTGSGEVEGFYDRLANRIQEAMAAWKDVANGEQRHRELDFLIDTVHGQAQLLGLSEMAGLIAEIHAVTHKVSTGAALTPQSIDAVARALQVAASMPGSHNEGISVDVGPVVKKLRKANQALGVA